MDVIIRPARPGDEAALGPLHNLVWKVAYSGLMPADYLASRNDSEATARWAERIRRLDAGDVSAGTATWVADVDGTVSGFLSVGPAREREMMPRLELMALYVHPDLHGAGVAQQLVARGLPEGPAYLWLLDGNERAAAFYRKLGFRLDGASKHPEPTATLEVRMVRGDVMGEVEMQGAV